MKIFKYPLPLTKATFELPMPRGVKILSVGVQYNKPVLWAAFEEGEEDHPYTKHFAVCVTGGTVPWLPNGHRFIGTFQVENVDHSYFVGHLFVGEKEK